MTFEELESTIKKYMLLEDPYILKLLCSFVVAGRLNINPPWLFIVSSSSGGKSTLLKALESCYGVLPIDDLTTNTFLSGMKSKDGESNSLLDKMKPNTILLFKDFTTIISKNPEERGIIIGQLRKIYDGDMNKHYGNGSTAGNWEGKVNLLAGVTTSIHSVMHQFSAMGERFLMYNFIQPDPIAVTMMATQHMDERQSSADMKAAFAGFIDQVVIPEQPPLLTEELRADLVHLADLVTLSRSSVERDWGVPGRPIKMVHSREMPIRFAKQIIAIAAGCIIVNGTGDCNDLDRKMLSTMALDSIPHMRRICLKMLTRYSQVETAGLATRLALPTDSIRMHLQDLNAHGVLDNDKGQGNRDRWTLKPGYRSILARFDEVQQTADVLTEANAEEGDVEQERKQIQQENPELLDQTLDLFGGELVPN